MSAPRDANQVRSRLREVPDTSGRDSDARCSEGVNLPAPCPSIRQEVPGNCPVCGMALEPRSGNAREAQRRPRRSAPPRHLLAREAAARV
ncbi:heavy metal-binding domain-containing protein [Roseomonas mucosa]|uniref:heavy metal-binding domain-containing protein n=1 Tax=Roseomonas mucosa TaxID=207340 RepID=UPI00384E79B0